MVDRRLGDNERVLVLGGRAIGLVAVEDGPGALATEARRTLAVRLVGAASYLALAFGASRAWPSIPARTERRRGRGWAAYDPAARGT